MNRDLKARSFFLSIKLIFLIMYLAPHQIAYGEGAEMCTYSTWDWNANTKRSENHRKVSKSYLELTPSEKDPHSQCSVCEEDQITINIEGIPPFQVCRLYADDVRRAVQKTVNSGFPIYNIVAYRVGRSKGPIDKNGRRTQFSNHSFGTAIDFNSDQNGLYTNCFEFVKNCRLLRGGRWKPGRPGTITKDSAVYQAFKEIGWKWAGQLEGRQKDFMHFSLSGD